MYKIFIENETYDFGDFYKVINKCIEKQCSHFLYKNQWYDSNGYWVLDESVIQQLQA